MMMMKTNDIERVIANAKAHASFLSNEAKEMERWPFMGPTAYVWRTWAVMWTAFAEKMEGPPQPRPRDTFSFDAVEAAWREENTPKPKPMSLTSYLFLTCTPNTDHAQWLWPKETFGPRPVPGSGFQDAEDVSLAASITGKMGVYS